MIGPQAKSARQHSGLGQQVAAARLGVSQSYLSMLEDGQRALPQSLSRKMVRVYKLSPARLPLPGKLWEPSAVPLGRLVAQLAGLGYPGFSHLRKARSPMNPAQLLLTTLAQKQLDARTFEALPWLLGKFWKMDQGWLVQQARLHNLQNRLGFVVSLARKAAQLNPSRRPSTDAPRVNFLTGLETALKPSLLASEEPFGQAGLSPAEQKWLRKRRSREARAWHVLTGWRAEALRYVA